MRIIALAGTLAAVVLMLAEMGQARSKQPDCFRSGRTVTANSSTRIFYRGDAVSHDLYSCWISRRKVRKIGDTFGDSADTYGIDKVSLAGRFVAFRRYSLDRDGDISTTAEVRDVRSGRTVAEDADSHYGRAITDLVTTDRGRAVFIEIDQAATRLVTLDGNRRNVVDEASGVERGSLAVRGSRIFWMRTGEPRTATLE
jgi:hypothetical protein